MRHQCTDKASWWGQPLIGSPTCSQRPARLLQAAMCIMVSGWPIQTSASQSQVSYSLLDAAAGGWWWSVNGSMDGLYLSATQGYCSVPPMHTLQDLMYIPAHQHSGSAGMMDHTAVSRLRCHTAPNILRKTVCSRALAWSVTAQALGSEHWLRPPYGH